MPRGSPVPGNRAKRVPPSDAPGRNGDGEGGDLSGHSADVDAAALKAPAESGVIIVLRRSKFRVLLTNQGVGYAIGHDLSSCARAASG